MKRCTGDFSALQTENLSGIILLKVSETVHWCNDSKKDETVT